MKKLLTNLLVGTLLLICSKPERSTGPSGAYINYKPLGITFTPAALQAGNTLTISEYVITNNGNIDNDTVTISVGFYLSSDNQITATGDIPLGSKQVAGLKAGQSDTGTAGPFPVPGGTPNGTYYVGVYVDPDNEVTEGIEADNGRAATTTLSVTGGGPTGNINYVPSNIVFSPTSVAAGNAVNITQYRVTNAGTDNDPSLYISVGFYLSTDNNITTGDVLLTAVNINALTAGDTRSLSQNVTIPSTTTAGNYYIGVFLDNSHSVNETNEIDNGLAATTRLTVTGGSTSGVNLVVTSVEFSPVSAYQEDQLTYTNFVVRNSGTSGSSTSFTIGFYLSTDNTITPIPTTTDIRLGNLSVSGGLGAGETYSGTRAFSIPLHVQPGVYYVGIYADEGGVVSESNENDNGGVATATLTVLQ